MRRKLFQPKNLASNSARTITATNPPPMIAHGTFLGGDSAASPPNGLVWQKRIRPLGGWCVLLAVCSLHGNLGRRGGRERRQGTRGPGLLPEGRARCAPGRDSGVLVTVELPHGEFADGPNGLAAGAAAAATVAAVFTAPLGAALRATGSARCFRCSPHPSRPG